ncbi:ABC-type transport system involved in multi-copper enzyme maturation permease subunit [Duganella sp. 1411]|uniref:M1 family aminopeptidase n=1 Tax=Duganella sp. 1411 TaxID=2806572 RepID=UPI001AEAEF0C|nr:M1 family aminopeptidase [Duganella sp. 1411]MBP1206441.1 ABC-type transport system involved in multi-copper enzyme maturation permease subunit [Duganella sp. 1411]
MLLEFFKFDLRYQLRQPLLWVSGLILGLMAFGATTSDAIQVGGAIGNVHRNAPTVVAQILGTFTVISMFIVTIFIAGTVLRDSEVGISDMLFATPMRKYQYLLGRFSAGLVACLAIFVLVAVGMLLGPLMPWVDTARVGPLPGAAYLWSFAFFVIPNLLFVGALLMLLAATTRSMMLVYVGVLGFFVLWAVAGAFTRDINNEWIAVLVDPFGVRAFSRATRYFSAAEANAGLPPFTGYLLANRVLWLGVAALFFIATLILFKPQRVGTGRRLFGKAKAAAAVAPVPPAAALPRILPRFGGATGWIQCWHILAFDARAVFKSVPFLVMLLFGVLNFLGAASQANSIFGTAVYPVTHLMLQTLNGTFNFMLIIVLTFYAGELIFKERQVKIADVGDAMPVPDWAPLLAKCVALVGVIFGFLLTGAVAAAGFQLVRGGAPIEVGLYVKGLLLDSAFFVLMGLFAVALQVLTNNKFIGYLLVILLMVSQIVLGVMHFDHNLYNFGAMPGLRYSDMNGYGHFLKGWSWYALYWSLFTVSALMLAQAFWVRGLARPWRARAGLAGARLKGGAGVALALSVAGCIATGAWIFYNTNVLNEYVPSDVAMDRQADYEKRYRKYKDLPQPRITGVRADVDIYPAERRVAIRGHYLLENKTGAPLSELRLQFNPDVDMRFDNLPPHQVVLDDKIAGFRVIKLAQPMAPGARVDLAFTVDVHHQGFTNSGAADSVNLNGTFFNNGEFFPHFGYQSARELTDRNERRKRGLGEPQRMAKLEDEKARANGVFGGEADWIDFDTTVSTSADQIAIAPGYLQKSWEQGGRRYFHYKMDRPMVGFFAYLSARWNVRKGEWRGVPIEVYYDSKHAYNVDRMIASTQKSLDYFDAHYTPYQHKQARILEFPNYQGFAQSFANTIPYSESLGFIADLRDKEDIDYVFYVTAHEMAHQWWGHQVFGANVQGSTMLIESLAQYSALMVMEKEYGRSKLRRFLRFELDSYLRDRGGELIEEQPLFRVENQQYIHYRKGSLVFYRLRDEIGEDALNRALKRFLQDNAYHGAPYPTSRDLLAYIRAEAPKDKQALITDLFEKIVFYDNRVTEAKAKQRADGRWDVTMTLHLAKMEADGKGKETPRAYDEPVEIAVFARAAGAKESEERVLFTDKRLLVGGDPVVTVTVKERPFDVGVDPYNKMIDRVSRDNRKEVTID